MIRGPRGSWPVFAPIEPDRTRKPIAQRDEDPDPTMNFDSGSERPCSDGAGTGAARSFREGSERLAAVRIVVEADLAAVDARILESLDSDVPLIREVGEHLISQGGKRLRPLLVLLSAHAFGYGGRAHVEAAAIIEFIHTATLLHDDVVDRSTLRRGRRTANSIWGSEAGVLVGDFLYSRAFQRMVAVGSARIMRIMADTTNMIAEGEVLQLANRHDPDTTEARYLEVVGRKTGKLFEAAARIGPVLAARGEAEERRMAAFGTCLGTAYQLVDDVLDYRGSAAAIGKNVGDDLADGTPTLPLIHAMGSGSEDTARTVREAIRHGDVGQLPTMIEAVESAGGIEYTLAMARGYAARARAALRDVPDTRFRRALASLAEFVIERTY